LCVHAPADDWPAEALDQVDAVAEIQLETSGQVIVGKSPSASRNGV
jgi:hypothetical protein